MSLISIISGALLIAVGIAGYTLSEAESPVTALIPAGVGILLLLAGAIVQARPALRKHVMHVAATVGLLGFLAAAGRLGMVLAQGKGSALGRGSLAAMALICGVFLVLCIKSFIDARRNRP